MRRRAWILVAGLFCAGCGRGTSPAGLAGLPPTGKVRILAKKVQEDSRHFRWLWTIMGERNWVTPTIVQDRLTLSGSYPLNSKVRSDGTQIWEVWVNVEPAESGRSTNYLARIQLRGSNAAVAEANSTVEPGSDGTLTDVIRAVQSSETTLSLPATVTLATVGRRTITLRIER